MKKSIWIAILVCLIGFSMENAQAQSNPAFGDNQVVVDVIAGQPVFAIYSGDINQDGFIDVIDYLDLDVDIQIGNSGYLSTDLNGDGFVDVLDYLLLDKNVLAGIGLIAP